MADKARRAGFTSVIELQPWEQATAGEVRITAAPARHGVPEITFVIQGAGRTVYFGADTLRIPELDEVPRRFPAIDLALLPINGLRIRPALNRQVVMTAEQAAEYCAVLKPKIAVPIHYAFTAGPLRAIGCSSNTRAHPSVSSAPPRRTRPLPLSGCCRLASRWPWTAEALGL